MITLEKDDERYKVMFKKRLINKRVKKIETSDKNHNAKQNSEKFRIKKRIPTTDSPFSSLRVLLKN